MLFKSTSMSRKLALIVSTCGLMVFLAACVPQKATNSEDQQIDPIEANFVWSPDSSCAKCHERNVRAFDDSACTASGHAALKDQCMTCHNDETNLKTAHAGVTMDSEKKRATLKKTKVSETVCTTCHDKIELTVATASSIVLTDQNGLVVNPHDVPVNADHANADITCSSCHKVHEAGGLPEVATGVCKNCHHHNVYECGTCH